ncbi:MAG TPA: Ada metal-binding domain-containing protein [Thermoanaerobaculia bacterium]|nr:Ada metal-binding domain-containing protein [Thermoanaerobaculia bacterium]
MGLSRERMFELSWGRDRAADGRFVLGVTTTGIYCLPSCPARRPRPENARFFATVEAARAAGLRACRRCRPDDFTPGRDGDLERLAGVVAAARRNPAELADVAAVAAATGVGSSRLHELFRHGFHTTPAELLRRLRVEAAIAGLLAGRRRVLDVGFEVGFDSASAFHEAFRRVARLAPGEVREMPRRGGFRLALPVDFRADLTWAFLGRDPDSPTERVGPGRLARALDLPEGVATLCVELAAGGADCRVEAPGPLSPASWQSVHRTALALLGLHHDPGPFERRLARGGEELGRLVAGRRGLRVPQSPSLFEGLTWAILGQQVNLAFAYRLRQRLIDLAGRRGPGDLATHPTPQAVAALDPADLVRRQLSRRKAEYLVETARAVAAGDLPLDELARGPAPALEQALLARRGIGPWTARYVMLRACGLADCVPVGDSGLAAALERFFSLPARPGAEESEELMRPFAPHRSFATNHLWTSLGGPA